jgi:hypothetical protein
LGALKRAEVSEDGLGLCIEVEVFAKGKFSALECRDDLHGFRNELFWHSQTGSTDSARQQRVRLNQIGIACLGWNATIFKSP